MERDGGGRRILLRVKKGKVDNEEKVRVRKEYKFCFTLRWAVRELFPPLTLQHRPGKKNYFRFMFSIELELVMLVSCLSNEKGIVTPNMLTIWQLEMAIWNASVLFKANWFLWCIEPAKMHQQDAPGYFSKFLDNFLFSLKWRSC